MLDDRITIKTYYFIVNADVILFDRKMWEKKATFYSER